MKLILDAKRCVACGACAVACMDQNDCDAQNGSFRTVHTFERSEDGTLSLAYASLACLHCEDAACIAACPKGCLYKDAETGFTVVDNTRCIGCRSCAVACPHGAPVFVDNGKMTKCDGCNGRVKAGLDPACVRACPFGALSLARD